MPNSRLSTRRALPFTAGTPLALEASAEAVFFQGTGVADTSTTLSTSFGLTLEDAGGRLLDYDDWEVAGTGLSAAAQAGPQREPGYLRVETTLDTPGQVQLVLQSYANARLGGRQVALQPEAPRTTILAARRPSIELPFERWCVLSEEHTKGGMR